MMKGNGCGILHVLISSTHTAPGIEDNRMTTRSKTVLVFIDNKAYPGVTRVVEQVINTSAKERHFETHDTVVSI